MADDNSLIFTPSDLITSADTSIYGQWKCNDGAESTLANSVSTGPDLTCNNTVGAALWGTSGAITYDDGTTTLDNGFYWRPPTYAQVPQMVAPGTSCVIVADFERVALPTTNCTIFSVFSNTGTNPDRCGVKMDYAFGSQTFYMRCSTQVALAIVSHQNS